MREMINYCIISEPEQYEDIMKILYKLEIFPMEEDPIDLKDYIDNFNFSEEVNGYLKFFLWCNENSDMSSIEKKLKDLPNYDSNKNLPRLELDGANV